ncbi:unnamed protein product, partial [Rotaria sordida]
MSDSSASFLCPISYELIRDPVIDPDDNSYVKNAIEDLIQQSGISPITRQLLSIHDLCSNQALNIAIDEYHDPIQPDIESNSLPINVHSSEITISTSYTN